MRIWDIDAGFLNAQSLLGEHRELHGIYSIIKNGKTGYSRHPETLRWFSHLSALAVRHEFLVAEMTLRGFNHHSPLKEDVSSLEWPDLFIDLPADQYKLLQGKYVERKHGRIPLPANIHELWASHKYSVMARDPFLCKKIGNHVAVGKISFEILAEKLVLLLRMPPTSGRLTNALFHMWGYVAKYSQVNIDNSTSNELLQKIQDYSQKHNVEYLLRSTALGELKFWC